jgi:hypothetical protein
MDNDVQIVIDALEKKLKSTERLVTIQSREFIRFTDLRDRAELEIAQLHAMRASCVANRERADISLRFAKLEISRIKKRLKQLTLVNQTTTRPFADSSFDEDGDSQFSHGIAEGI